MRSIIVPDPIEKETTIDATDLTEAIALANALKSKLNTLIEKNNLLSESMRDLNDEY